MNILLIGHAQHGKDTLAKLLADHYTSAGSKNFHNPNIVYPVLKDVYGYQSPLECFQDRHNHRAEWYKLISEYNSVIAHRTVKEVFESFDIYNGLRSRREYNGAKAAGLIDYTIWVDASKRKPLESRTSMELVSSEADYIVDNNGSLDDLILQVPDLLKALAAL